MRPAARGNPGSSSTPGRRWTRFSAAVEDPSPTERRPRRSAWVIAIRVLVALLGLAALAWTIHDAGPDRILEILPRAAPWIPAAIALEGVRIGFDALATRMVLGQRGREIPFRALFAAQVAAHGVMGVSPAGRSASEAVKAMLLSAWVKPQVAIAMGATNQANVLISSALFSLVCLGGAHVAFADLQLDLAILVHFVVLFAAGVGMRVAATNPYVERFFARRLPRLADRARLFHEASRDVPLVAAGPVIAMAIGRTVQTVQYAAMAYSVGISMSVAAALAVQGVNLVAAAIGVMTPGQLGTAELVFRLAADALETDPANATSIALVARVPQFLWIGTGLLTLLVWRARREVGTG